MGRAMLRKSLIQFSVDGWSCVPSLLFDLRSNYGGGNEDNGDLLQQVTCTHCCTQCPDPAAGLHASTETPGHSQASLVQSLVGSLLLSPRSCCTQGFVPALQESVSPGLCKFSWLYGGVDGNLPQESLCHIPSMIGKNKKNWRCNSNFRMSGAYKDWKMKQS